MLRLFAVLQILIFSKGNEDLVFSKCLYADETGVCFQRDTASSGGKSFPIIGRSAHKALLGFWSFDYLYPVDESGFRRDFHPTLPLGPDRMGGSGASAALSSEVTATAVLNQSPMPSSFKMSAWLYVVGDAIRSERSATSSALLHIAPMFSLLLEWQPSRRRFFIRASAYGACALPPEVATAQPLLLLDTWLWVEVFVQSNKVTIYVDQLLHSESTVANSAGSPGAIELGRGRECKSPVAYIDDLRLELSTVSVASFRLNPQLHPEFVLKRNAVPPNFCSSSMSLCSLENLDIGSLLRMVRSSGIESNFVVQENAKSLTAQFVSSSSTKFNALCCASATTKNQTATTTLPPC